MLDSAAQQPVTSTVLRKFAATARKRMRIEGGGYRRDHLRALAQRVEVDDREVRIMGSKSDLLRTLAAISGVKSASFGVRTSVLDWRKGWDSNPRWAFTHGGFQDRCLKPLGHPSIQCIQWLSWFALPSFWGFGTGLAPRAPNPFLFYPCERRFHDMGCPVIRLEQMAIDLKRDRW